MKAIIKTKYGIERIDTEEPMKYSRTYKTLKDNAKSLCDNWREQSEYINDMYQNICMVIKSKDKNYIKTEDFSEAIMISFINE